MMIKNKWIRRIVIILGSPAVFVLFAVYNTWWGIYSAITTVVEAGQESWENEDD